MKFNLNDKLRVKLTPYGRQVYAENFGKDATFAEDTLGRSIWAAWDFMATFGYYMCNGCPPVIETNVELLNPQFFDDYELKFMESSPDVLRAVASYHEWQQQESDACGAETTGDDVRQKELLALAAKIEAEY